MGFQHLKENVVLFRAELTREPFLNCRVLGFACIRGWVYLMFMGAAASSITWTGAPIPPLFYLLSTASLFATLLASALAGRAFLSLMGHPAARSAGPLLTSLGTLLLANAAGQGAFPLACGLIGAIVTGIGSGIIDLGYGELYRNEPPSRTVIEIPLAFFLAALTFALIAILPPVAGCLMSAALPLISGWILLITQHAWSRKRIPAVQPIAFNLGAFAWRIGLCACLIGIADGMVRAAFITSNQLSMNAFLQWPLGAAALVTMAIVYASAFLSTQRGTRTIYKAAIFVMAFFFMLLPVFTQAQNVESTMALAGYGTFNVLIWMLLAEISYNYRLSSTAVFGIGWGMVTLGVLLGAFAGAIVEQFAPFAPQQMSLIALIATTAILFSFFFVFKESDLIELTEDTSDGEGEAPGGEAPETAKRPPKPRFHDRCVEVATQFELSPKETEVMILFAKGRSATRIQEELFISKGTVSTHLRHIYQKMDVHSKQELLDIIEGIDRP